MRRFKTQTIIPNKGKYEKEFQLNLKIPVVLGLFVNFYYLGLNFIEGATVSEYYNYTNLEGMDDLSLGFLLVGGLILLELLPMELEQREDGLNVLWDLFIF